MSKVLVTGATGFLGSYVIEALLQKGCQVIATASGSTSADSKPWFSKVKFIPLDLKNLDKGVNYYTYFDQPDSMIHLAWQGLPNYTSDFHLTENLPIQLEFLHNLLKHGLKDLTVTGTCLEYGMQEGCLTETLPAKPENPYAIAKHRLQEELTELTDQYEARFKWVRLFYMYGKGQNPKSLFSQLEKAIEEKQEVFNMSGGEQIRDFLPVEKMAEYIVDIALQNNTTGIINCCSGEPVKLKDLVTRFLKDRKANIQLNLGYYPYTTYEPMNFWGDTKKLTTIIKA